MSTGIRNTDHYPDNPLCRAWVRCSIAELATGNTQVCQLALDHAGRHRATLVAALGIDIVLEWSQ